MYTGLLLVILMTGLVRCEISSCYCMCSVTERCLVTEDNMVLILPYILQVLHLSTPLKFPHFSNFRELIVSIKTLFLFFSIISIKCDVLLQESECQEQCAANQDCAYYTW